MSKSVSTVPDEDGQVSRRLVAIAAGAALGGFLFGFDSAIINGTVDAVRQEFALAPTLLGFVVSCALLGAGLGSWSAGICADRIGRVRTMVVASVLLTVSAIGSGLVVGVWDLIAWRFLGGVGIGFASVIAPAYIAEISPARIRGRLGSMQLLALVTGIFLAILTSALLADLAGGAAQTLWLGLDAWRWMFIAETVPAIIYGILAVRLPESPRYLVNKDRIDEAGEVLRNVLALVDGAVDRKIREIRQTVNTERKQRFSDLLGGKYFFLPLVWVGILLSVFQQFVGINVIFYYSTTLWQSVGFQESDSFTISVITAVTNIVATLIAISLIDKVGRRPLLLFGAATMTVSLFLMAVAFAQSTEVDNVMTLPSGWGAVALIAANVFVVGFGASWGPVVWVLLGEMFPNRIRALALGLSAAAQWVANFAVSTTFPPLAALGLEYAYGLYGVFSLLALVFVWKMLPETKGRQLESMDELATEDGRPNPKFHDSATAPAN
ncbi:sugar porter family MFS transporter [Rhodococcus sp. WMMA185]|uniref:sugar porter family MFS transporter n=1 Tax=Rhodococcus sp. WMMA185 TaxID=679318 RepID=UPI001E4441F9|nr:sugar porter family MFS transporter [Rhodococcus sp. WMMA185]